MTEGEQKMIEDEGLGSVSRTLAIHEVPVVLLDKIEAMGAEMSPPVRRNPLIIWVLEAFAAGRLVPAAQEVRDQAAA